jgi:dUTP pyrophosphatase
MKVKFQRINPIAELPTYAHPGDAGMDIRSIEEVTIEPGAHALVHTGLVMVLPPGYEAQVRPRSGLALKNGVTVLNAPGTIDEGYRGEIGVILVNFGKEPFKVEKGAKIAQIVIAQYTRAEIIEIAEFDDTERGDNGFGSSGLK